MSPLDSNAVQSNLRAALADLDQDYAVKRRSIMEAIRAMGGDVSAENVIPYARGPEDSPPAKLSVGDDRLEAVRRCVYAHSGGIRQADIAHQTGINSGSVSVALRRLRDAQLVEPHGKVEGSTFWTPAKVPALAA